MVRASAQHPHKRSGGVTHAQNSTRPLPFSNPLVIHLLPMRMTEIRSRRRTPDRETNHMGVGGGGVDDGDGGGTVSLSCCAGAPGGSAKTDLSTPVATTQTKNSITTRTVSATVTTVATTSSPPPPLRPPPRHVCNAETYRLRLGRGVPGSSAQGAQPEYPPPYYVPYPR